jgi:putative ABC transport system ATP-binding protein
MMIQFQDVSKVYPTRQGDVRALDGVSLRVESGEFVAIRGPSGGGKSTLLALAGGLALPTSGRIVVAGEEISRAPAARRAEFRATQVGFVFQMFHLLPFLNVIDNVLVAASRPGESDLQRRAEQLLDQFGLLPRRHHRPAQLSAGEKQRVAMARALLNRPRVVLADEPTGNLDPANADRVLDALAQFHHAGGTILLVTHEQQAAARAPRTILLEQGRLAEPTLA